MVRRLVVWMVVGSWRHPRVVTALALVVAIGLALFAGSRLGIDTDESKLISSDLGFRHTEMALDRAFPNSTNRLVAVIDAPTADLAEVAVDRLAAALAGHPDRIRGIERPAEEMFFRRYGLMFLSPEDLTALADRLIAAQPLLGAVARDPSLRGLLTSIEQILTGVAHGQADIALIEPLIERIDLAAAPIAAGGVAPPADWQSLMAAGAMRDVSRRFLLMQAVPDFGAMEAGAASTRFVRDTARAIGLVPAAGYQVRLTGSVALSDANFATVADGIEISGPLSVLAVLGLLFLGVRSARVVAAIMASLVVGLIATGAFAAATVGTLNPISVAFAVMFVGIAVDFAIQFVTAYRNERHRLDDAEAAIRAAAASMAAPLPLAAIATAVGFLSFVPTAYTGVSQLGLIAGGGMLIALLVDFTVLPALLALVRPPAEPSEIGLPLDGADRWIAAHARAIVSGGALVGALGVAALFVLPTDFDPLHLQDPKAEAVATFQEMARDPESGVYAVEALAPSLAEAHALAQKFEALPGTRRVMTLDSFVPDRQDETLPILEDVAMVLGPTLTPPAVAPTPSPDDLRAAVARLAARLVETVPDHEPSRRLADHLAKIAADGPERAQALHDSLASGLSPLLASLRRSLDVAPLTRADLPADLVRNWISADGQARVQVVARENMEDAAARARFVRAVASVTPEAAGAPIAIEESGRVVIDAFSVAALGALTAIGLLLGLMLRRLLDSVLVLAPLLLGALATVIAMRVSGLAINFANIIALPLLLGIGVAFNIYYVVNWRNGVTNHLSAPTTRAVLFSALTTGSAFGALAVSPHLGTASMGLLLFLSLGLSVVSTVLVLPALFHLLGKPKA
jgi:hopanoid biosynthesis associated RND transporter like protein HpnN